ncbi:MAG: hypothetical protein KGJ34_02665 [Patescibacteria group bacterium]|nr:hypothetical protein [Patescibacteria group bacterium]
MALEFYSKRTMAFFALVIALSCFAYGALLLLTVERAAQSAKAQASIQSLSQEVATLQSQYLALTQNLTPALAAQLGFVMPSQSAVAEVFTQPQNALTLNSNGSF